MPNDSKSKWDAFIAYNMADMMLLKHIEELEYARWVSELKRRWGIFWRIPYWWHHGRPPVSNATK